MPLPVLPLAVLGALGAATAYVVFKKPAGEAPEKGKAPLPGGGAPGVGPDGKPQMTSQMQVAFDTLITQGTDPDAMDAAADALSPFGFDNEAAKLHAQALALRKARLGGVQPGPAPASSAPAPASPSFPSIPVPNIPAPSPLDIPLPSFPVPSAPLDAPTAMPSFAVVTTNDPPPSGDVFIVPAPNTPGTPGVGAEKDGIVLVMKADVLGDGVWSQVVWGGGQRLGPVTGFMKAKFLRPSAVGPLGTAVAGEGGVFCIAPSGCRLRIAPAAEAQFRAIVGHGEPVSVRRTVQGNKLEATSPGRGGWALVKYKGLDGWLPLEWLSKA